MASSTPFVLARGTEGLYGIHGPPSYKRDEKLPGDPSKNVKVFTLNEDGNLFAWCNGVHVKVVKFPSGEPVMTIDKPLTSLLKFSPLGNFLVIWEPFGIRKQEGQQGAPNLSIWDVKTQQCVKVLHQKKYSNWSPVWSDDEVVMSRLVHSEVHFFQDNDFNSPKAKFFVHKVYDYDFAPGPPPYHSAIYIPGVKAQPSFLRLFEYPKFEGNSSVIASRSFYNANKVEFIWHKKGKNLLALTSTDVDRSGGSYYGEQNLHYLDTKGETSVVKFPKNGPIYSIKWNPNSLEFCAVYGYMPAKATLFNAKCEPLLDFDEGPRNAVYFSPQGNKLILAGFGNLRGNVEVWDCKGKKRIVKFEAADSTHLEWCPDGEHILTSTTSPRLRVGNGYRVWHYTGSLLFEHLLGINDELWEAIWQPGKLYPEKEIKYAPVPGIQSSQPTASKEVYRPPGARNRPEPPKEESTANMSKAALKNKKKRDAKKANKGNETSESGGTGEPQNSVLPVQNMSPSIAAAVDPELEKKRKNIMKKLEQINKLKEQQASGKTLEVNQLQKLAKEEEFLDELAKLTL